MTETRTLRDALRKALVENGVDSLDNLGTHSWRCEVYLTVDPDKGGGPCDCVDALLDDLEAAALRATDVPSEFSTLIDAATDMAGNWGSQRHRRALLSAAEAASRVEPFRPDSTGPRE